MAHFRIREYLLAAAVLTTYALMETHWAVSSMLCGRTTLGDYVDAYYENDVVLEFSSSGFDCGQNSSSGIGCNDLNVTRIIVDGKVWEKPEDDDLLIPEVEEEGHPTVKLAPVKSNVHGVQIKTVPIEEILKSEGKPHFKMLDCAAIDALFQPASLDRDFTQVELGSPDADRDFKNNMAVYKGSVTMPELGQVSCFLKEAKFDADYGKSYRALMNEIEKRTRLGQNTRITGRLLGECVTSDVVRIAVEIIEETTALCDDEDGVAPYSATKCYQNEKLKKLIEDTEDNTRAAFAFIRELLCLLAEVEMRRFFVKDIHGKHISVTSDFKVYMNNVDNLSHHGSRNILSGSICKYDSHCPVPTGDLWTNASANHVVYEKCNDINPFCTDTSCVGYNSTLHVCGVARWIIQPLYSYFHRIQDRSRITHIMISSMNSWPFLRRPVTDSCSKATLYLGMYDKDMETLKKQSENQNAGKRFHLRPNH